MQWFYQAWRVYLYQLRCQNGLTEKEYPSMPQCSTKSAEEHAPCSRETGVSEVLLCVGLYCIIFLKLSIKLWNVEVLYGVPGFWCTTRKVRQRKSWSSRPLYCLSILIELISAEMSSSLTIVSPASSK